MRRLKSILYQYATAIVFGFLFIALGCQALLAQETELPDRSELSEAIVHASDPSRSALEELATKPEQPLQKQTALGEARRVYLPLVSGSPRVWQQIGAGGRDINTVDTDQDRLYLADRTNDNTGGVYYLNGCDGATLVKSDLSKARTFDVDVQDQRGVAIAFDATTFFSSNDGVNWSQANGDLQAGAYEITFGQDNLAYAGTDGGVYRSADQGEHWEQFSQVVPQLRLVNHLWYDPNTSELWIGTNQTGAWRWRNDNGGFRQLINGLETDQAKDVWSLLSTTIATTTYTFAGTSNGAYMRIGDDDNIAWSVIGGVGSALGSKRVYSLAVDDSGALYAGTSGNGVWQIAISSTMQSGAWQRVEGGSAWSRTISVRDLIWAPQLCQGLVAATVDGVWVFR